MTGTVLSATSANIFEQSEGVKKKLFNCNLVILQNQRFLSATAYWKQLLRSIMFTVDQA